MGSDYISFKTNDKHQNTELAKKIGIFLLIMIQIPLLIEVTVGEKLDIIFVILTTIILIVGLILNHFKKTYFATTIVSTYFYGFAAIVPYVFGVLIISVPTILAVFVTYTYVINSKSFQKFNLLTAVISLCFFFNAAMEIYDFDREYFTHMAICVICFTVIFSVIYYFKRDVNEYQKKLEQNLTFLKQITDLNPHFIYTTDTKNNFTFVNETMRNFDGENPIDLIGKNVKNFWKPYKDEQTDTDLIYNLSSFKNLANETRFHEVFEKPLLDSNGLKIGNLGVSIDVTEKRIAQVNLKKSERNYRELYENNQLGIVTTKEGKFNKVNSTFCKMTGYPKNEIIGFATSKIMHQEDYAATLHLARQVDDDLVSGQSFEHRFIRKDKSIGFAIVHLHKSLLKNSDNSYHMLATLTDISKLKATEAALKESEAIYRTLVNNAFDGIEIHESIPPIDETQKWQHKMIVRNNRIYDILSIVYPNVKKNSFSLKDLLNMSPAYQRNGIKSTEFIKCLTPEFRKNNVLTFEWQYGNKQNFIDTEMTLIRFKIEDKQYVTSIYKDISERKKAEFKLKKSLLKIERKNKKIKKALDSNDALEKFAFSVSHELKDPLISIQGFAELLEKSIKNKRTENNLRDINAIIHSTQNMRNVISKFLLFARLDTQKTIIKKVNLNELLEHLHEELHVLIAVNKASIEYKNIPNNIYIDETLVHQLFQNLISNAIKYSSPQRLPKIIIEAAENDHFWNFTVQDNGIGIAPDFHQCIFNFFERVDASSNKGTGIGLALCKKIVQNHGGKIQLISEIDKGSTFEFSISKNLENK